MDREKFNVIGITVEPILLKVFVDFRVLLSRFLHESPGVILNTNIIPGLSCEKRPR